MPSGRDGPLPARLCPGRVRGCGGDVFGRMRHVLQKKRGDSLSGCPPFRCPLPGVWSGRCLRLPPDEEAREAGRQTDYRAEVSGSCGNSSLPWSRVIQMVLRLLMTAATSR